MSTVLAWGLWIPVAQIVPGVPQRSRTFYATLGNTVFAAIALVVGGGHLSFGWKTFWLPFAGGVVWTAGNYTAFRASENIGLARASGTWTPLNIITAFVWGALLFGELDGSERCPVRGPRRRAGHRAGRGLLHRPVPGGGPSLGRRGAGYHRYRAGCGCGCCCCAHRCCAGRRRRGRERSPDVSLAGRLRPGTAVGLLFACAAGLLWGSYFVPAQWAKVPAQVGNFPLALGIVVAGRRW